MSSEVRKKVSVEELAKIKDAMDKETIERVLKRYKALYLYLSGMAGRDVAQLTGITVNTICNLYKKYQLEGLSGIPDKTISGRPVRLTIEERNVLKDMVIHQHPFDVGVSNDFNWTAGLIAQYIKREYGYAYSIRGITALLARLGFYYKYPTYVFASKDKEEKKCFMGILKFLI